MSTTSSFVSPSPTMIPLFGARSRSYAIAQSSSQSSPARRSHVQLNDASAMSKKRIRYVSRQSSVISPFSNSPVRSK